MDCHLQLSNIQKMIKVFWSAAELSLLKVKSIIHVSEFILPLFCVFFTAIASKMRTYFL